jgi:hypothetical protein
VVSPQRRRDAEENAEQRFSALAVGAIAAAKFAVYLYAGRSYGYFVDELYNLALARHLAWGYVDVAPMIALIGRVELALFGDGLLAIRILPALAGAALVVMAAGLARELGGGRFAQALAALCVLLSPGFLALDHYLNVNAFEPLCWMGCAWLVIRLIRTGNQRLWLWFGLLAGVGLETKHSMLIFGFGLIAGLALTAERRHLFNRWLVLGGLIALVLFLPNLLWNVEHHFPFVELQRNIQADNRNVSLSPFKFLGEEVLSMLPLSAPIWIGGLWYLFFHHDGRRYRALAWAFAITAAIIYLMNPRVYYLFPAFPLLLAAGAVWAEGFRVRLLRPVYCALMVLMAALLAPTLLPLLPPETYIRYTKATHLEQPRIENHQLGPLPQLFADQFGWEQMAAEVARFYRTLPPDVQARTAIFGQNYGQAGAIDLFGPKYGLPPAISGHQNYYFWGPRSYTGESVIVMGDRQSVLEQKFASVEKVGRVADPYAMPYEHIDIFYCQRMKWPLQQIWPKIKNWN